MLDSMSSSGKPETRTQILEAARGMFEELGYYGAGLGAVAKEAGVSRQAIYLHFPSKADLLRAESWTVSSRLARDPALLGGIEYRIFPDAGSLLEALQDGEVDVAAAHVRPGRAAELRPPQRRDDDIGAVYELAERGPDGDLAGFFLVYPHYGPLAIQGSTLGRVPVSDLSYDAHDAVLAAAGGTGRLSCPQVPRQERLGP